MRGTGYERHVHAALPSAKISSSLMHTHVCATYARHVILPHATSFDTLYSKTAGENDSSPTKTWHVGREATVHTITQRCVYVPASWILAEQSPTPFADTNALMMTGQASEIERKNCAVD